VEKTFARRAKFVEKTFFSIEFVGTYVQSTSVKYVPYFTVAVIMRQTGPVTLAARPGGR
jgi:hypothetical protein